MGYYSDVVIAIDKQTFFTESTLKNTVPKAMTKLEHVTRTDADNAIWFFFSSWKWYDSYPEIKEIDNWLETLDEKKYAFIRNGEEPDDIEERGSCYNFDLYISVEIDCPVGFD